MRKLCLLTCLVGPGSAAAVIGDVGGGRGRGRVEAWKARVGARKAVAWRDSLLNGVGAVCRRRGNMQMDWTGGARFHARSWRRRHF